MAAPPPSDPSALEAALGYRFASGDLLRRALVHTSYVNERTAEEGQSNERLEFLGDAVLGLVVAHYLFRERPEDHEGDLTVLRAWLVRQPTLARWAQRLDVGPHLLLGRGELRAGGRERPAILARAMEAILGAVYLDGGLEAAQSVIEPLVEQDLAGDFSADHVLDAKSRLQQAAHSRYSSTPTYTVLESSGPGHAPTFAVEVRVADRLAARGEGASKRAAEQAAAEEALRQLDRPEDAEPGPGAEA